MITDYRPKDKNSLQVINQKDEILRKGNQISVLTFNIGYCGLDKGQDFFMDGGTMSRSSSSEQTLSNLKSITKILVEEKPSFLMLQEVDLRSTRSFKIDQLQYLTEFLPQYSSSFGLNYKVPWVPVPIKNPMGAVHSGIVNFSRFRVDSSTRYQFPGKEKWPTQLFELDRAFVESRTSVEGGKELIVINSHLSAFDEGGKIRAQQLQFLRNYIIKEYNNGNYVIAGGDWNHELPESDSRIFSTTEEWPFWLQRLPSDFTPEGFKWGIDKFTPTVRTNAKSYVKGENFTAIIDGFLVSPNVDIVKVTTRQLDFQNSDHNPVIGKFILK